MSKKTTKIMTLTVATALTLAVTGCCKKGGGCASAKCQTKSSTCTKGVVGTQSQIKHLNIEEVAKIVTSKSAIILDARSGKWDNGQRIPGAKSLSSKSSDAEIAKMLPNKDAAILTYCNHTKCPASNMLVIKLKSLGYTNISEYPEGIKGWKAAGKSIEESK